MSNHDLLSEHEIREAASQGWSVCTVVDQAAGRMRLRPQILPLEFKPPFSTAEKASRWVIQRAQQGDKLALRALRLVVQGNKA